MSLTDPRFLLRLGKQLALKATCTLNSSTDVPPHSAKRQEEAHSTASNLLVCLPIPKAHGHRCTAFMDDDGCTQVVLPPYTSVIRAASLEVHLETQNATSSDSRYEDQPLSVHL